MTIAHGGVEGHAAPNDTGCSDVFRYQFGTHEAKAVEQPVSIPARARD